jgi:4-alpha-glucanotransferase
MRSAGILMPVASFPSNYGIGDFGTEAYKFVDIIHQMQLKIWQVLPLNPLGYGNSPYQAYSSFAGDELYISVDRLVTDELLTPADLIKFNSDKPTTIEYQAVRRHKEPMLRKAFANFKASRKLHAEYVQFTATTPWLKNYAVFLTLKKANDLKIWTDWPTAHKNWIKNNALDLAPFQEQIDYEMFLQFIFYRQWFALKQYANNLGIQIMGDIPIYIGMDSLDVWENQDIFLLDENQQPTFIAGVPPDYFSATGQRWGNPLYNWDALEADGFKFWIKRLAGNAAAFDIIRIDHFRAFDTYWKIPASCPTAVEGEWVEAPGYALFDTIYRELPGIKIVAEDLGDLRKEVLDLRDHYNLKGMKIFQFIFEPHLDNSALEKTVNTIVYTGTHDNSTLMGWYNSLSHEQRHALREYFQTSDEGIKSAMLAYILNYQAEYVIFPAQDIIGSDDSSRLNTPGTVGSPNWEWKLADFNALQSEINHIAGIVRHSSRI